MKKIITGVKVNVVKTQTSRVKAFVSVEFDKSFVVHDIRIVELSDGYTLISMPSKEVKLNCPDCNGKNSRRAVYCNWCGLTLPEHAEGPIQSDGNYRFFSDVCHPVNNVAREELEDMIFDEYERVSGKSISSENRDDDDGDIEDRVEEYKRSFGDGVFGE